MQGMFVTGATFRPDGMNFSPNAEDVIEVLNKGVLDQALTMAQVCEHCLGGAPAAPCRAWACVCLRAAAGCVVQDRASA